MEISTFAWLARQGDWKSGARFLILPLLLCNTSSMMGRCAGGSGSCLAREQSTFSTSLVLRSDSIRGPTTASKDTQSGTASCPVPPAPPAPSAPFGGERLSTPSCELLAPFAFGNRNVWACCFLTRVRQVLLFFQDKFK